jgi:hypothetical protein
VLEGCVRHIGAQHSWAVPFKRERACTGYALRGELEAMQALAQNPASHSSLGCVTECAAYQRSFFWTPGEDTSIDGQRGVPGGENRKRVASVGRHVEVAAEMKRCADRSDSERITQVACAPLSGR